MNERDEVEIRFERQFGGKIRVSACLGLHTIARIFDSSSRNADVFLWVNEELRKGEDVETADVIATSAIISLPAQRISPDYNTSRT